MENKDIIALTDQELTDKLQEQKANLNKLKINHKISPVENPMVIRVTRKTIAKLMTEASKRRQSAK